MALIKPVSHRVRLHRARKRAVEAFGVGGLEEGRSSEAGQGLPREEVGRLVGDPGYFIESCLHVRHIDGGRTVPFMLSDGQRIVTEEVRKGLLAGEMVRLAVLKSRRALISSLCEALGYWYTSTRGHTEGLILAHKQDATEELFQIIEGYWLMDERKAVGLRPMTRNSNRKELRFGNPSRQRREVDPGLESGLRVTSADAKDPGMGGTYHYVHASEVSRWPSDEVWRTVGIALSKVPGTVGIMETTANGQSGLFYETYRRAKKGPGASDGKLRGTNDFLAIFLPWWQDRKNRVAPLTAAEMSVFDYETPQEMEYAERWKLVPEQVIWRRKMIAGPECYKPGVQPEDVFRQEYPADDEEAFLASGKHFFLLSKVADLEKSEKGVKPPKWVGEVVQDGPSLEERGPHNKVKVTPKFEADERGCLRIWGEPRKDTPYLVVVDPAEGLTHGDASAIGVLDRLRLDWVAYWQGTHLSARQLAWTSGLLGWFYGTALLAVEHNNHGIATIEELRRILYPRLWHHTDVTRPGSEPGERVGWVTSPATRNYALQNLEAEVRSGLMGIHFDEVFEQMRHFVYPEREEGKKNVAGYSQGPRAEPGYHDDLVMVTAIGLAVHLNAGVPKHTMPVAKKEEQASGQQMYPMDDRVKVGEMGKRRKVRRVSFWR